MKTAQHNRASRGYCEIQRFTTLSRDRLATSRLGTRLAKREIRKDWERRGR